MTGFSAGRGRVAFSLVEVVLALAVTTFCLIVLFGLLSVGLNSNQTTLQQSAASAILAAAASDLYAAPVTIPPGGKTNSLQYSIPIPANPPTSPSTNLLYFTASGAITNSTHAVYLLTVLTFPPSTGSGTRSATFMDLKVTWPAAISASQATGKVETFVALNRN